MKVDSSGSIPSAVHSSQEAQRPHQQASEGFLPKQETGLKDTVTITSAATQLSHIEQKIKQVPATDAQHVEQLQFALRTGSYSPDHGQVAGKLLNFEAALNNVRHFTQSRTKFFNLAAAEQIPGLRALKSHDF